MKNPDSNKRLLTIAVPAPLRRSFDYLPLPDRPLPTAGCRVWVPFGPRKRLGVVVGTRLQNEAPSGVKLKMVDEIIDQEPLISSHQIALMRWAADYYQHGLGEVVQNAFPLRLRKGLGPPAESFHIRLRLSAEAALEQTPSNARRQIAVINELGAAGKTGLAREELLIRSDSAADTIRRLTDKGLIESFRPDNKPDAITSPPLNPGQQTAVNEVSNHLDDYRTFLLRGITGSGKTEVYLEIARRVLHLGRQVMVMVPEIALTPQLVDRFRNGLGEHIAVLHSGLSDVDRHRAWLNAVSGKARVVLGTRSAVFTDMPEIGLIVIDEEHDPSYKQQEGFRYHARDVAIKKAAMLGFPVLLGSATPSLESWLNARRERYTLLELTERAGGAKVPHIRLVDMNQWPQKEGFSPPILNAIRSTLDRGEQCLVFLNRRGFAPVVMCSGCGWQAHCSRCDALMTVHRQKNRMRCHHCGREEALPVECPECSAEELFFAGIGTERVEKVLSEAFSEARICRVDRDTVRSTEALEESLRRVRAREVDILVGTQLLSKGHDFPGITLVSILNADQGMFSIDFRAGERLFQSVLQVAGRAGRGDQPGEVLLQSAFCDHPAMQAICRQDYPAFADLELKIREQGELPPFSFLALFRSESPNQQANLEFLSLCAKTAQSLSTNGVEVMDPIPAPMERRAGRFRAQLLIQAKERKALARVVRQTIHNVAESRSAGRVRWSIDVDPIDLY